MLVYSWYYGKVLARLERIYIYINKRYNELDILDIQVLYCLHLKKSNIPLCPELPVQLQL